MNEGIPSLLARTEHARAKLAHEQVQKVAAGDDLKKYRSAAERLPAMILTEGLLQTLAFYKAKDHLRAVCQAVEAWFRPPNQPRQNWRLLEDRLLTSSVADYRADTYEALAFAVWLKRFAEARYKKEVKRQKDAARAAQGAAEGTGQPFPAGVQPGTLDETEAHHE